MVDILVASLHRSCRDGKKSDTVKERRREEARLASEITGRELLAFSAGKFTVSTLDSLSTHNRGETRGPRFPGSSNRAAIIRVVILQADESERATKTATTMATYTTRSGNR